MDLDLEQRCWNVWSGCEPSDTCTCIQSQHPSEYPRPPWKEKRSLFCSQVLQNCRMHWIKEDVAGISKWRSTQGQCI